MAARDELRCSPMACVPMRCDRARSSSEAEGGDSLDGEAGHAVRQAALVAQLEEEPPSLTGEDGAQELQLPAQRIAEARPGEPDDEVRLRLVQLPHGGARRRDRLLLRWNDA